MSNGLGSLSATRPRERLRREQRTLLVAGGALFAGYYLCFWVLGIYTTASLLTGLTMALGLAVAGVVIGPLGARLTELVYVVVALVLGLGATASAAFSGGSHCIGFHTLWALPLIFGLFARDSRGGSFTIGVTSLVGGLFVLLRDESNPSRIAQWVTLCVSAAVFGFVKQQLERRNLEVTVTETEQAQTRLAAADRMASVGILAAGVAHEINNPMAYVTSNLEFVTKQVDVLQHKAGLIDREVDEALADAKVGCEKVTAIVKTLSRLSRPEGGPTAAIDLNQAIIDVLRLSRRELESVVKVNFVAGEIAPIPGDESRLGQVFLNLVVNGAHAVELRPDGPRTIDVRSYVRELGQIVVEFKDTGAGIAPEALPRIFDPFFTTKPPGKGTGLGLAICAEIVEQHHGVIEVESTVGEGSVFRVVLPAPPPLPPEAEPQSHTSGVLTSATS
ncbi:MAG: ATP-binding protein [Myxococcales bacterium]|nr:ATP-binding protein [Myxococcales bacterium]